MTKRWIDYFEEETRKYHSFLEYAEEHWNYHKPLYFRIKQLVPPPAKILEIGCGLGASTIYLNACGYDTIGIDEDIEIITQARENAKSLNSLAKFEQENAFDLSNYYGKFDLVFSLGVIEHFEIEKTVKLLQEQTKCARYVIAVVPTRYTKYARPVSDERIYTLSSFAKVFKNAGLRIIRLFGYGNVCSPFHNLVHLILPMGVIYFLQNRFSYAMNIGCIGERKR